MTNIDQVTPAGFSRWLAGKAGTARALIIDVREPSEWALASLAPGSDFDVLHICMGDIPGELNRLDPDRPTALLCHHGGRSQSVAQFLARNGFEHVANITGGIDAWADTLDQSIPRY